MPDRENARFEIQFNADVLVPVLRAFQKFSGQENAVPTITFRLYGGSSGVRIDAESCGQRMTALVMPLRMVQQEPANAEEQPAEEVTA